ncbi:MAG: cbb3-type cytochrome oxidase assembly protein CcoS [Candidatus Rokuibacteriota bacterium]|nr:MAG: cbb3-type cytochrome oxidase assembly protein CcoS [Candidatus Rokubacteria bacterium]PYN62546.1 MAG: cbb3-type cytochrome oxidase assembly protein CcoS [Candidatus Rokubacteria bacterium]
MLEHLTLGAFAVAVLMGLAALSAFVWGAVSGAFRDVETIKYRVLQVEEESDEAPGSSRRPPTDEPGSRTPRS